MPRRKEATIAGKAYGEGMSLTELFARFPNDEAARQWFEAEGWPDGPTTSASWSPASCRRPVHPAAHVNQPTGALANKPLDRGRPMAYTIGMKFEWDDAKNDACFESRGFDFAYAVRAFLDRHRIVAQDRRRDYGEDRYRLLGMIDGRTYVVVYTMRGSTTRVISARKANRKEVENYEHNAYQD